MPPRETMNLSHDITNDEGEEDNLQDMPIHVSSPPSVSVTTAFSLWDEIKEQFKTAYPTLIGMAVSKIPWLLSLRFVGGIGSTELAAAALATTLCNVTGLSLSVGLSSALTTLTGQARGELQARQERQQQVNTNTDGSSSNDCCRTKNDDEESWTERTLSEHEEDDDIEMEGLLSSTGADVQTHRNSGRQQEQQSTTKNKQGGDPLMPLVFLYRGTMVQLACVLPVGFWWLYGIQSTLVHLGQGEELSAMTQDYLRILAPQLWAYSICWTLTAWLQAMEMAFVPAYAAVAVLVTHIPLNMFYIHVLDWGYLGCAAATVTTQSLQLCYIAGYLFGTQRGRQTVLKNMYASAAGRRALSFYKEARLAMKWKGIVQYLALALPGVVIISEWWASEVSIFLSGRLSPNPDLALGGMTLYQSINSFLFMFPVACSVAGATRVSNLLGADLDRHAAFASNVSIVSAAVVSATIGSILYFTPHTLFPSFFAPDEQELVEEASSTIPLLALYVFADGIQTALNGTVKGCGRQVITMPIVIVAYWIVGLPLAYYLAFVRNEGKMMCDNEDYFCGDVGLVTGMTVGTWVHMLFLAFAVLCFTDWKLEARKAYERVRGGEAATRDEEGPAKAVEMLQLREEIMSTDSDSSTD